MNDTADLKSSHYRWRDQAKILSYFLHWSILVLPLAIVVGSVCALFVFILDLAINCQQTYPWLLFLLPWGGLLSVWIYSYFGRSAEGGSDLIFEEIHKPTQGVPRRMAPLIFIGSTLTLLFGGSSGREGAALQMGASLASSLGRGIGLNSKEMRIFLMCGIAAGFGGVFGTPIAGAIFAIEVLAVGRMNYEAIVPCFMASTLSDWVSRSWGTQHEDYHFADFFHQKALGFEVFGDWLFLKIALAAIIFAAASIIFSESMHYVTHKFKQWVPSPYRRVFMGGLLIILAVYLLGTRDFLGLGVESLDSHAVTIGSSFHPGGAAPWSWAGKNLFTVLTLSSGFKGGEVTTLFYIGSTLGNVLATWLHAPVALFACLGFVAVFSAATNAPLASILLGIELFGSDHALAIAFVCFVGYLLSGHKGIYSAQRIETPKGQY